MTLGVQDDQVIRQHFPDFQGAPTDSPMVEAPTKAGGSFTVAPTDASTAAPTKDAAPSPATHAAPPVVVKAAADRTGVFEKCKENLVNKTFSLSGRIHVDQKVARSHSGMKSALEPEMTRILQGAERNYPGLNQRIMESLATEISDVVEREIKNAEEKRRALRSGSSGRT